MQLSPSSKLVRYAYFLREFGPPFQTTLCGLFWNAVLRTAIWAFAALCLGRYIYCWIYYTWTTAATTLGIVLGVAIIGGAIYLQHRRRLRLDREQRQPKPPGVIGEALWGLKNRVCPVIYIKDEQ